MTDERDIQSRLEERVAQRDKRRARFAGTVSHDLKTPLNAIVGFTSVLLADVGDLSEEQQRQLGLVYESAQSLVERINDLLQFYRLEAGRVQLSPDWLMPAELMIQLAGSHRAAAVEQGGDLALQLAQAPSRIRLDGQLVRIALDELCKNAVRFGGPGTIQLSVTCQDSDQPSRVRVCFEVTNGTHAVVPEVGQQLSLALDPERLALDRSYDGLGLGLAQARETARLLGGWITLDSPSGQPARFCLVLDLADTDLERD